ncbi:MAG: AAA family ATPase [Proteobacteria bacterium]|nr:AAA family ATPase [Pseudomonadota bacterium]MBU1688085.1 AAA family ATPase [Pseudomonadota bacterium]
MTPDRDFFYASRNHSSLAEAIKFGLDQGEGFIIALGEVGTGKTLLLRMIMTELDDRYATCLLVSPQLTPRQLLLAILADIASEAKSLNRMSLDGLLRVLNDELFKLAKKNKRLLIIIDEAQNLPDQSLEQLRLLSNFESDKQKWLQILLVGQPELKDKLLGNHLRQLLQRVSIMETLHPLSEKEVTAYVHFRLNRAGRGDLRLDRKSCRFLWRTTGGVPRLINKIMGRVLLIAYARQQGIDHGVIREAAASLHLIGPPLTALRHGISRLFWPLTAVLILAIVIFFISSVPETVARLW